MEFSAFLLTLLLSQTPFLLAEDCTTGFSVVAPELAVPGKTTAVLVTLNGPTSLKPLNVTLKLRPDPMNLDVSIPPLAEATQEIRGHGILPLDIPADIVGSCILQTLINCTSDGKCEQQSLSQMRLVGPVRDVIIRPAKHAYRPGESISFWIMALDHDLQIAVDAIGTVSIKDPAGTKVAIWDEVSFSEGVLPYKLPLSENVRSGRWLIHVEVESAEFSAPFEVAPGVGNGLPDVAVAEEHYVELRFGREMRRRYKPGLPFTGKVEAMSTEKSVRVRVKVYDNTTSIYSQDIEISNGEGTFVVPAILADSDVIALQAELVSVESKEIESHYVLAREPIHKWNSSSDCYLLIEGVEHTLQPEEDAHVTILSTCPCERDLHYVITTDGRVTDWAQRRYEDPVTSSSTGSVCRLTFSFTVRSIMAPVSQLLVYYVTPEGEPVSDVISFDVKLLHRQVYVNVEEREWWLPGQSLDLEVVAEPSSLVCLLGGRSGGNGDIKFDPRISEEHQPGESMTGEIDFLEAGVSFFQRECIKKGGSGISAVSYKQRGSGAGPSGRRRPPESLVGGAPFDQLWLWECFNYTTEIASMGLTITAPEEAGKWSLWALTVSTGGLRFSNPVTVQVFRPLQAEFHLPPSLRVRETLEVDIKIGNNINSCMDVTALLALSEGAQFLSNGLLYVTERLRLGPHGATSLVVRLLVTTPGRKNMTVEVNGYTTSSCEGSNGSNNTTLAGAVVRSATVNVYPEGIVRTDTESAYFCANDYLLESDMKSTGMGWKAAPKNEQEVIVEINLKRDGNVPINIALAEKRNAKADSMYSIILGDSDNNDLVYIVRGKKAYNIHLASATYPNILPSNGWGTYWISWENNNIMFGIGAVPHNNTLLKWHMDKKLKIQYIGCRSFWGNKVDFRIWKHNDESGFSQVLHLDTPRSVVPGSESGELMIAGGMALPPIMKRIDENGLTGALASLASLITLNFVGCNFNHTERKLVMSSLPGHVQNILSYRKEDNSFSEHQMLGSHKATIDTLEALEMVQNYFSVDPELIGSIKRWVQLQQQDDGSFVPLPADVKLPSTTDSNSTRSGWPSRDTALSDIIELTTETIYALFEIGIENDVDKEVIDRAKKFLESKLYSLRYPENIASAALASIITKSRFIQSTFERLEQLTTTDDDQFGWPHLMHKGDAADWLYETESEDTLREPIVTSVGEYKATLYALAAYLYVGNMKMSEGAARYLVYRSHMLDRHHELLFPAVKILSRYARKFQEKYRSLTVSLATSGMELTDTVVLHRGEPYHKLHLPSLPTKVFVYATGTGCATIQGRITYSTYSAKRKTALLELWSRVTEEILPDRSSVEEIEGKLPMLKIKTCFRWKGALPSAVLRLEVSLFSGYELATTPPQLLSPPESMAEMQHSYNDNKLWFIFANVSTSCPICVQYTARSAYVITSLRPAFAKIYPASREDLAAETFFHTYLKSNLLKSITEDDLITWFGRNRSVSNEPDFKFEEECQHLVTNIGSTTTEAPTTKTTYAPLTLVTTTTTSSTTNITESTTSIPSTVTTSNSTSQQSQLLNILSVATYTINVDNSSISNLTENSPDGTTDSFFALNTDTTTPVHNYVTTVSTPSSTHTDKNLVNKNEILDSDPKEVKDIKQKLKIKMLKTKNDDSNFITTTQSTITTFTQIEKRDEAIVEHFHPKHINKKVQDVPKMLEHHEEIEDNAPATFAPEDKNDEYVLMKKEALWSMLNEELKDEIDKKISKIFDGQRLRNQGFT